MSGPLYSILDLRLIAVQLLQPPFVMTDSPRTTPPLQGPITARSPFDHPDADVILRSSDNVDFRVFKLMLSLTSPVFKDMFSLPQQPRANGELLPLGLPIIPVTETSSVLENLLLYCYPGGVPQASNLESASAILEAATKYEMGSVLPLIGNTLLRFAESDPLSTYAIFSRYGWRKEMQVAASHALKLGGLGRPSRFVPELEKITGGDYHRLLAYHYACGAAAQNAWRNSSLVPVTNIHARQSACHCAGMLFVPGLDVPAPEWLKDYLIETGKELFLRPCPSTIMDSGFYEATLAKAARCVHCGPSAAASMGQLRKLYATQVKKVVDEIKLEFKS